MIVHISVDSQGGNASEFARIWTFAHGHFDFSM